MVTHFPRVHIAVLAGVGVVVALLLVMSPGSGAETQRVSSQIDLHGGELQPLQPERSETYAEPVLESTTTRAAQFDPSAVVAEVVELRRQHEKQAATPTEPAAPELTRQTFEIRSGDTLSRLFSRAGLNDRIMYRVLNGEGEADKLGRLREGYEIEFVLNDEGELHSLTLHHSRTRKLESTLTEDGYVTRETRRDPEVELKFASGEIESSFALSTRRAGLNNRLTNNLANIFGWQINFSRDLRTGDRFAVLYEALYLDGERVGTGRIVSAQLTNRDREYTAVLYTDENGRSDYFTPDGESLRKAFKREPLDYHRISSAFNPNRRHPILNRTRPHNGTDFAAPTGTPVKASGDGRVVFASRDGGYGKTIRIQHGNNIMTVYAHLRGYAGGIRPGTRVRQGQTIGYVGMTGLATGPHLHYEYRENGVPRNPMRVQLPDAEPVPDSERQNFLAQAQPILAQLSTYDETFQVALADE